MQVILNKPIYMGGTDVGKPGSPATVDEMRGRELIKKGYASAPQAEGEKPPATPAKASKSTPKK
ncbi:hypothetical protein HW452_16635 [Halomonas aquamarina]|uniref:Uncharacterized protein n=1 Tax=Vreelandella aquamarina TaxID=77097 RepID=A0ACC5VZ55_9GAMM|nr:hypothetical protein [Halomonas aquamarina]MBZ5489148.1 hypothetical protein [Halomonas aquamarina]